MKWAAKLKMYVVTFLPGLVMRTIKKDTNSLWLVESIRFQSFHQLGLFEFFRLPDGFPELVQHSTEDEPFHGGAVLGKHPADTQ